MTTIVIPDVHQRIKDVQNILDIEKEYDEVVFTGDFFDSKHEYPIVSSFSDTCEYLKHLVLEHDNKDKFRFLIGNHDMMYIFLNNKDSHSGVHQYNPYYCTGCTSNKIKKFRKAFYDKGLKDDFFIKHFKIAYKTQGYVLSHAGISEKHIPNGKDIDYLLNSILPDVLKNFRNINYPNNFLLSGAGVCRGGNLSIGGITWLDWNMEFKASENVGKQILGHTRRIEPECLFEGTNKESWNIDTEIHYAKIIDRKFQVKHIP
jgi:hypothetical protein